MLTLRTPRTHPLHALPLLWEHHRLLQDTLSKSSSPSKPRPIQQQTPGRVRPCPTASRVRQPIPYLTITPPQERSVANGCPSGIEEGRSKENAPAHSGSWNGHAYTNEQSRRNRDFRDRRRDRPPSGSPQGSPAGRPGRSKIRARSRSGSTARSSSGSRSSSRRQTHRLPPHRPTRGSPSPLLARRRDVSPDSRDRYNSHPHSRYDSAGSWFHDGRGQYRRDPPEDYYPGDYDSPRPSYRDYYDRGHERDPYGPRYESTRGRTVANDYRPVSPRQPSLNRCPRSPSPGLTRTPPQPRSPPPPTPPRSELQTRHPTISILLPKKPPAHVVFRSPPSVSRPPSPSGDGLGADEADVLLPERIISKTSEKSKHLQPPHQPPRPNRPALRRTREEELKAYGRTFVGSGQQEDYDAMTKLGEGTFGHVLFSSTCA